MRARASTGARRAHGRRLACWLVVLGLTGAACGPPRPHPGQPPTVVFLSDFGVTDDSVAICKGVMLSLEPRLRVVDLTHEAQPFAIADGARLLAGTTPYYPAGTVFLAVIDPGVGSARKALAARSGRGQYFVLPDNGLLTLVAERDAPVVAREITNLGWTSAEARSATFHGRDVFAPVAARLARGDAWTEVGPVVASPVSLTVRAAVVDTEGVRAEVVAVDGPYGNLVTNVDAPLFAQLGYEIGDAVTVTVAGKRITLPFVRTFSDVAPGAPLLYVDSRGRLALALNQGSFARAHHITPPAPLTIPRKPR